MPPNPSTTPPRSIKTIVEAPPIQNNQEPLAQRPTNERKRKKKRQQSPVREKERMKRKKGVVGEISP